MGVNKRRIENRMRQLEDWTRRFIEEGMDPKDAARKGFNIVTGKEKAPPGPRQYSFNGLKGCVEQRQSRETGLVVGLYNAEQAGMDPEAGPWATVCESHGHIVNHPTLEIARSHLGNPMGWCDVCNGSEPKPEPTE